MSNTAFTHSHTSHSPATASDRRRWAALIVLCAGFLMVILDITIVNVALPSIGAELRFAEADLPWVVNAYMISFGGLLLLAGRLGDLIGRRRIFLAGLVVFTSASLLCGLAPTADLLIAARILQGIGGAMTSAVILGMIATMFPEPRERAKAIGIYGFVAAAGGSLGLLAGGVLTEAISWQWIFVINLPIGIATALAALRLIEDDRGPGLGRGADVLGGVLVTTALMLGVLAIVQAGEHGWGSPHTLVPGAAALLLLAGFIARQARAATPLLPLCILRSRNLTGANVIQILMEGGLFGMFVLGTLYLERVLGYHPIEIGLAFLPLEIVIGGLSLGLSARMNTRYGPRATLIPGLALFAAGLLLFARAPVDGSYVTDVLPVMILIGVGAGLSFPALMTLAVSGATSRHSGLASGLFSTTQQVGSALGLALLAALATSRTAELVDGGTAIGPALTSGYQLAFQVGAALVTVALGVAVIVLRSRSDAVWPCGGEVEPRPC